MAPSLVDLGHRPRDDDVTVSWHPVSGWTFALGTTRSTCTATDDAGNTGTATFTVKVEDTTAPVTAPATSRRGHRPGRRTATYDATATDVVDGDLAVTCLPPRATRSPSAPPP